MNDQRTEPVIDRWALLSALDLPPVADLPHIVLSISPCRSGSTMMLRVFGAVGVQSYFQPLKNILRWHLEGDHQPWHLPPAAQTTIYLKETLGPYTLAESTFDPFTLLLDAGVPAERLHLVIYGRHPLNTWLSWQKWWRGHTEIAYFIASYQTVEQIRQLALRHRLTLTTLVYEAFQHHSPATVVQRLMARLGLPFSSQAVVGWDTLPAFGTATSHIVLPREPARFITPRIHDTVHNSSALRYHTTTEQALMTIPAADRQHIHATGLCELHQQWTQACNTDLKL